ncbi:cytochrome P450 3A11-like, partial [Oppia nitens]|uniref:cytochrome P450 3A11-like n=1 Tax=Oppia nitens TaxID=1686743 RepID=UPI0023DC2EC4
AVNCLLIIIISYILVKLFYYFRPKQLISPNGKAVLITGCDSGFGNLLAYSLNERGFRVYAACLDPNTSTDCGGQRLAKTCRFTDQMVVLKMNVTDDREVHEAFNQITEDLVANNCKLWSVVNNAGYMITSPVEWGTLDDYERLFAVNVFGLVRVTRIFLPLLRSAKGRVVNMSSTMGRLTLDYFSAYCMSKASIIRFSDSLRKEMQTFGVRVATIMPGGFKNTGLLSKTIAAMDTVWLTTDESVKSAYGQQYYEQWKRVVLLQLDCNPFLATDPYIVINDMIDAIMNTVPLNNYEPIGNLRFQLYYRLYDILGQKLLANSLLLLLIIFFSILLFILYQYYRRLQCMSVLKRNGISGPKPHLIFGNLFDFKGMSSLEQKDYLIGKYGKTVGLYYGCKPVVLVADPELAKHIQIKDFQYFNDRTLSLKIITHPIIDGSVHLKCGQRWRDLRSVLSPMFSGSKLRKLYELIDSSIDTFLDILAKNQQNKDDNDFDIYELFKRLTADLTARTAFGVQTNVQTATDSKFLDAMNLLFNSHPYSKWYRILSFCFPRFSPLFNQFSRLDDQIDCLMNRSANGQLIDITKEIIDLRKNASINTKHTDILQSMFDNNVDNNTKTIDDINDNKQSIKLTDYEIQGNCIFFYIAGYRNASITLGFVAHILVNYPDIQERVRQEVRELYASDGRLDYNTLSKLEYMECVINETMRLYPPSVAFATREANADYTYDNITIPKGTVIQFANYYMHRDPDYWPEPEKFDPERFSSGRRHEWHPYSWQTFGNGPRSCVGLRLAYFEMKLCLAKLLINYRLEPGPRTELGDIVRETKLISMVPKNGVFVKIVKI